MLEPIVCVEQGKLLGKICTNIDGKPFFSFQGVPYANSPINELRFKPPQPPPPWTGIRNATKEGDECYSKHMLSNKTVGSENCLFLNIYTQLTKNRLKPVMVWIHGGGFRTGSGNTDVYGPEYLLTEDIVLVTFNYRLGILGFLRLEDSSLGVSGNAGLKDMVMALKWTKQNISAFSGDPNNVTIFGESAGAAAVHLLVLSPLAKGLFHKSIAQSGSAFNAFARGQRSQSSHIASILKLSTANETDILQHLMALTVEELLELSEKIFQLNPLKKVFAPVIEEPSPEAFITEEPIKIIRSGNYNRVPMVFGYNTLEGTVIDFILGPQRENLVDFEKIIPFSLQVDYGTEISKNIANKIKKFYYKDDSSQNKLENYYLLHTDNYLVRDVMFAVLHHSVTSKEQIYLYRMSVETKLNIFKKSGNIEVSGVAHGDDIGYLFKTKLSPELEPGSLEELSVRRFVKYWTHFAKNGNPNTYELPDVPTWKPTEKDVINFIDIGEQIVADVNPDFERMKFWNEIFSLNPLYLLP